MPISVKGALQLSPTLSNLLRLFFFTGTQITKSQLCDDNCLAEFTQYNVKIFEYKPLLLLQYAMHECPQRAQFQRIYVKTSCG